MNFLGLLPLIVLVVCFIIRAPIGLGMLSSCVIYLLTKGMDVGMISDAVMSPLLNSVVIIAIPLFIFPRIL